MLKSRKGALPQRLLALSPALLRPRSWLRWCRGRCVALGRWAGFACRPRQVRTKVNKHTTDYVSQSATRDLGPSESSRAMEQPHRLRSRTRRLPFQPQSNRSLTHRCEGRATKDLGTRRETISTASSETVLDASTVRLPCSRVHRAPDDLASANHRSCNG